MNVAGAIELQASHQRLYRLKTQCRHNRLCWSVAEAAKIASCIRNVTNPDNPVYRMDFTLQSAAQHWGTSAISRDPLDTSTC